MSSLSPVSPEALRRQQYARSDKLMDRLNVHARFSTNPHGFPRWVFEKIALRSGERVLELGCGPGRLWSENADRLPEGIELCLSDFSEGMLAEARFVQSLPRSDALTDSGVSAFRDLLDDRIRRDGAVDIPKSVGVFLARPRR